jgi:hypothetical protein
MRQVDDVRCRNAGDGTPEVERGAPAQEIHGLLTSGRWEELGARVIDRLSEHCARKLRFAGDVAFWRQRWIRVGMRTARRHLVNFTWVVC